jgi:hypothetical protein
VDSVKNRTLGIASIRIQWIKRRQKEDENKWPDLKGILRTTTSPGRAHSLLYGHLQFSFENCLVPSLLGPSLLKLQSRAWG